MCVVYVTLSSSWQAVRNPPPPWYSYKLVWKRFSSVLWWHKGWVSSTVETALYNHPLVQQKPVLNSGWSVYWGSLRHAHAKSTRFFSSNSRWKVFIWTVSTHLQPYAPTFYIFAAQILHKGGIKHCVLILQVHCTCTVHVNGFGCAISDCHWSRCAGSHSPQPLFYAKSSVHGISVIKTRQI